MCVCARARVYACVCVCVCVAGENMRILNGPYFSGNIGRQESDTRTKIAQFDVAIMVEHEVRQLDVSVDVAVAVNCIHRQQHLGSIKFYSVWAGGSALN